MKLFQLMFKRETVVPMLALTFASVVSVVLVIGRIAFLHNTHYAFLIWNLFLAWMPMLFALLAREHQREGATPGWRFFAFGAAWLLFFPNAPYIFTDIIHLTRYYSNFYVDLVLILISALTGMVLGFLSLYLMQSVVRRMAGELMSWVFIVAVAFLSGFGIFFGRILRLNSWDILLPWKLFHTVGAWAAQSSAYSGSVLFSLLFAAFLIVTYLMLYALTHLSPPQFNSVPTAK
jgi:uncharacterized membrane protein